MSGLCDMALPVAGEGFRFAALLERRRKASALVRHWECGGYLRAMTPLARTEQVGSGDMVMMADFRATHPAEKFLGPIRASAVSE